uniref:Uncharacterized protein n=1 Tax=Laticauda laticaudata TaxID=8630 RepID=A0A8C5RPK7_LATLA
ASFTFTLLPTTCVFFVLWRASALIFLKSEFPNGLEQGSPTLATFKTCRLQLPEFLSG